MANEFKVKNGLIVIGDLTTSGTITINGALAATQSWVTSQGYLTSASLSGYATQSYVTSAIAALVDSAPAALDTLNELAAALGDDANFSTTITTSIGNKVSKSGDTMTGNLSFGATSNLGLTWGLNTDAAFIKFVSTGNQAGGSYLEIGTQDDLDEEIKFTQSGSLRFYLATDGFLKNGSGYKYVFENGTWGINITGNANYATTAGSANTANTATTAGALTSMNISQFTNNSGYVAYGNYSWTSPVFGQYGIKSNLIDNVLYSAADRFEVFKDGVAWNANTPFNLNYDSTADVIPVNTSRTYSIVLNTKGNPSYGIVYTEGYLYLSFYYVQIPASVSGRVRRQNGTWENISGWTNVANNASYAVWRGTVPGGNWMVEIEITINANSSVATWFSQWEYVMGRPGQYELGIINKAQDNSLWRNMYFRDSSNNVQVSIGASGLSTSQNLNISGTSGLNFNSYGGGFYMQDSSWIRTVNYKSIWTQTGLLGTDGGLTVGYGGATPPSGGAIISGNVGIGTTNPAFKFEVGAVGSGYVSAKLTQTYEKVRYNNFDLLGYDDGHLWMIGNNNPSIVLASGWDWDNQVEFDYVPNTVGAAAGVLSIGQTNKNNANYTHGITRFFTNGSERLRINSAGNVGIGTTTPGANLDVAGGYIYAGPSDQIQIRGVDNGGIDYYAGDGTTFNIRTTAYNNPIVFSQVSGERMRITSTGNIGIGTTSPANKLVVTSDASPTSENSYAIAAASASDPAYKTIIGYDYTNDIGLIAAVRTGIGWRNLSIPQGSLGIGTTNPGTKLHVAGNAWINRPSNKVDNSSCTELPSRVEFNNAFASGQSGYMIFRYPTYNNFLISGDYDGNIGGAIPNIQFGRQSTVYMHINSSDGNIGIGTTTPASKLHVVGPINIERTGVANVYSTVDMEGNFRFNASGGYAHTFLNNGSELVRIMPSGNVGIGTTAPGSKLSVLGNNDVLNVTSQTGDTSLPTKMLAQYVGLFNNGANGHHLYINSSQELGSAEFNITKTWGGYLTFGVSGDGTARTRALYVNANGYVGVNVNPISGDRFEVAGSVRIHTGNNWDAIQIYSDGANGYIQGLGDETGLRIRSEAGNILLADNRGNVGIGTTSPSQKLHVVGNQYITGNITVGASGNYSNVNFIRNDGSGVGGIGWRSDGIFYVGGHLDYGPNAGNAVRVYGFGANLSLGNNTAGDVLTVTNGGNVGIGTTSPAYKLDISGNSRTTGIHYVDTYLVTPYIYGGGPITMGNNVFINSTEDGKLTLRVPSGDSSEWNYINFTGSNGVRDAYLGTDGGGTPTWYRDDNGVNITLSSSVLINGNTAWHAGNDGSGSGLDADLLDGLHASSFVRRDTTNQFLKPYQEYGSSISNSTVPSSLVSDMGGGGLRVDFLNGASFGTWAHAITFSGYSGYNMYQLAGHYKGSGGQGPDLYVRCEPNHNQNSWSSWQKLWHSGHFTDTNVSNWNTAYGWGNHASAGYATTSYVTTQINNLIAGAPGALDTLDELAAALGDDASFATTVTNSIAGKVSKAGDIITTSNNYGLVIDHTPALGDFVDALLVRSTTSGQRAQIGFATVDSDGNHHRASIRAYKGTQAFEGVFGVALRQPNATHIQRLTLDYLGNLTIGGFLTESSSLKLKENIEISEGNLEKVVNLRPVTYNKIGSQTTELGLIAEEVAEVYPEFVQYDENGEPIGVNYSRLTAALIGAVKELTNQVQELNKKING